MPTSVHKEQVITEPVAGALPAQPAERVCMSVELAFDMVLCGVLMVGLSFLAQHLQLDFLRATLFTGLVGGGLCLLWGILERRGTPCCGGAMVTLAVVSCVFAYQAVQSWATSAEGEPRDRNVPLLMMVLVVFCVGTLVNLIRERKAPQA
jgi:peptidoglycan/LPS O-acetylase OafA/YrhL